MSKTTIRNLIIALTTFVVIGGAVLIAFLNIVSNSATLEEQIAAVAAQTEQEQALLRLQRIEQNSVNDREELESYFFFRQSDSISFLSEIERIAPTFNLTLETTDLIEVEDDNREWIQATFGVIGSEKDTQDFIKTLENIPYVSRVIGISMTKTSEESWETNITVQVQLLNYD